MKSYFFLPIDNRYGRLAGIMWSVCAREFSGFICFIDWFFVYIQLNVKTVLFQIIHFSICTVSMSKTVLFQTIQFSISRLVQCQKQFYFKQFSLAYVGHLNVKRVLFQAFQFSIRTQFSSIWPINRILSGATTPGQSGSRSDGNEGVLRITQSSSITGTLPSACLVSYPEHSLVGVYSLQRSSRCILQSQPSGQF